MGAEVELDDDGLTVTGDRRDPGRRPRPARRRRADAGRRRAVRARAETRRGCAASRTSAATRPTGWPRSRPSSAASAATSRSTPTGCEIEPAPLHGGVFHTYDDHRMAHAAVILGLAVDGVLVENVATTAKTFPGFAGVWAGCSDRPTLALAPMTDDGRYDEHDPESTTGRGAGPGRGPRTGPPTTTPCPASWSPSTAAATPAGSATASRR